ncbi:MAG: hypothetical protein HFH88_10265 [Lachnospiraceae bacterium]|nr:hypothetical protein [Lachnospiraceae bacterium]
MAERRIVAALYVDEEGLLGKVAEVDELAMRLHHASLDLTAMLTQRRAADFDSESAAEGN